MQTQNSMETEHKGPLHTGIEPRPLPSCDALQSLTKLMQKSVGSKGENIFSTEKSLECNSLLYLFHAKMLSSSSSSSVVLER